MLARARISHSVYRSREFGGEYNSRDYEAEYDARDRLSPEERGSRSFEIASLVINPFRALEVSGDIIKEIRSYGKLSGFGSIFKDNKTLSSLLDLSFNSSWAPLHGLFCVMDPQERLYELFFLVGIIAYGRNWKDITPLKTLAAFVFHDELRSVVFDCNLPVLQFAKGQEINTVEVGKIIERHFTSRPKTGRLAYRRKIQEAYQCDVDEQKERIVQHYVKQWPSTYPTIPYQSKAKLLDIVDAHQAVSDMFSIWTANKQYREYFRQIQPILSRIHSVSDLKPYVATDWRVGSAHPDDRDSIVSAVLTTLTGLLPENFAPHVTSPAPFLAQQQLIKHEQNPVLRNLVNDIRFTGDHTIREEYRALQIASQEALNKHQEVIQAPIVDSDPSEIKKHLDSCAHSMDTAVEMIFKALVPSESAKSLLGANGLWPRITIRSLMRLLLIKSSRLDRAWKATLLTLGRATTYVQRARRLLLAHERLDIATFDGELYNHGQDGWNAEDHPEWLLIEMENDMLIRGTQAKVAQEMLDPSSGTNSLIQLNMGKWASELWHTCKAYKSQGKVNPR